jgi:hypothetical protein
MVGRGPDRNADGEINGYPLRRRAGFGLFVLALARRQRAKVAGASERG